MCKKFSVVFVFFELSQGEEKKGFIVRINGREKYFETFGNYHDLYSV